MQKLIPSLSPSLLESVIADDDIIADEIVIFRLALVWAGTTNADEKLEGKRRKAISSRLVAKHICLKRIPPSDLSTDIAPSGLVNTETLMDIFQFFAVKLATDVISLPYCGTKAVPPIAGSNQIWMCSRVPAQFIALNSCDADKNDLRNALLLGLSRW